MDNKNRNDILDALLAACERACEGAGPRAREDIIEHHRGMMYAVAPARLREIDADLEALY